MAVFVVILDPISSVAMNKFIEVRPLLQILIKLQHITRRDNKLHQIHCFRNSERENLIQKKDKHLVTPLGGGRSRISTVTEMKHGGSRVFLSEKRK